MTSAHFPKFVLHCSTRFHELRKVMSTSKPVDSSAAFLFEVPGSNLPPVAQELQIGGTRARTSSSIARQYVRGTVAAFLTFFHHKRSRQGLRRTRASVQRSEALFLAAGNGSDMKP